VITPSVDTLDDAKAVERLLATAVTRELLQSNCEPAGASTHPADQVSRRNL
jgi:hypothetical protein